MRGSSDPRGRARRLAGGIRALVYTLGVVTLGCGSTSLMKDLPPPDAEVQFTDTALDPVVAHVQEGGNVVWINEDSSYAAVVFLPSSVKDGLTCGYLRPEFGEVTGGYLSQPIAGDIERVSLPCPLKPGRYDYKLILYAPNMGGPDDPVLTLPGSIVVEAGASAP
jgi:hypothetical protein